MAQKLAGQPYTVVGDGNQTRCLCYVDDLIEGMILLMDSKYKKPVNIGNPNEFSIKELANLVRALINPNLEFQYKELPKDDPRQRRPSIQLAKELLKWEPKIELKHGLVRTIDWFKDNI